MALHGPHQGAQKSTSTGSCDSRTVALNSASETFTVSTPAITPPDTTAKLSPLHRGLTARDVQRACRACTPSFAKVPTPVKLFLPQTTLEEWAGSDRADVHDQALVLTGDQVRYPVEPAVHVTSLVSGPDEHKLLR